MNFMFLVTMGNQTKDFVSSHMPIWLCMLFQSEVIRSPGRAQLTGLFSVNLSDRKCLENGQ